MVQSCASPPTILMNSDHIVPHEQHPFQAQYEVPFQLASACATDFRDLELAVSEANKIQISSAPLFACITSMDSHGEPLSQVFRPTRKLQLNFEPRKNAGPWIQRCINC
jgi:hypothetical protein